MKMNFSDWVVNESEFRTRRHWLLSTLCFLIFYPLAGFAFFCILSIWVPIPDEVIMTPLVYAVIGLIPLLLSWYFAYRKFGRKLLTFYLITSPVTQVANLAEMFRETYNVWVIVYFIANASVFLWWYVMSLKIRKINKAIRERKALVEA